jgi:hypothetical protein
MKVLGGTVGSRKGTGAEYWSKYYGSEDETGKPHSHEGLLNAREERHSEFAMP